MELLDRTIDLVFKLLFVREPALLRSMLEAILNQTVVDLEILNPEISGEGANDKGIRLDIRVQLKNELGEACERVDVEMQLQSSKDFASRIVYYAARDFADQLRQGDKYNKLTSTFVVIWQVEPLFKDLDQLHSIFELRERITHRLFSDQLQIHLLQLSALANAPLEEATENAQAVRRWARFLTAMTQEELERLAQEDPMMETAKVAINRLSMSPEAQRIARERADEIRLNELSRMSTREEGKLEGLLEGERKGLLEGERKGLLEGRARALADLIRLRALPITSAEEQRILACRDGAQLEGWWAKALKISQVAELFAESP